MTVAWTTLFIIALLLPGIFVLVGFAAAERYSREIVRASAAGEVAVAFLLALLIHGVAWAVLALLPVDWAKFFRPLTIDHPTNGQLLRAAATRGWKVLLCVVSTAGMGLGLGWALAREVVGGRLRFLATHQWASEVLKFSRGERTVKVFVMTNVVENDRILMYKGFLEEFFLKSDGNLSYVLLKNCSKLFIRFEAEVPETGRQLSLFDRHDEGTDTSRWNYLLIEGSNIRNVLFDRSPDIEPTPSGEKALDEALASEA